MPQGSSGSVTNVQNNDPWSGQQPYLSLGFQRAEQLLRSNTPQYYPNSTVVPFSADTQRALDMQRGRAIGGNPLLPQAQQAAQQSLTPEAAREGGWGQDYLRSAAGGQFIGRENPYIGQLATSLDRSIRPGIQSQFEGAGRRGSLAEEEALTRAMSDAMAPYLFNQYGQERGLQQQAAGALESQYGANRARQLQTMALAPTLAMADYADIQQLADVGARKEAMGEAQLADKIARWDFDQLKEANKLAAYQQAISGNYGGTTTLTQPYFRNPGASALGGALSGAALGKMMGSENPWLWAAGGGLAGLF